MPAYWAGVSIAFRRIARWRPMVVEEVGNGLFVSIAFRRIARWRHEAKLANRWEAIQSPLPFGASPVGDLIHKMSQDGLSASLHCLSARRPLATGGMELFH